MGKRKGRDLGRGGNLEPARAVCHVLDTWRSNGRYSHFGNLAASSLLDAWLRANPANNNDHGRRAASIH